MIQINNKKVIYNLHFLYLKFQKFKYLNRFHRYEKSKAIKHSLRTLLNKGSLASMVTKITNVRKYKNQNFRFQKKVSNLDLNLFSFFSLAKSTGKTLFHNPMVNGKKELT